MSFNNSEAVEKELEATIMNDKRDIIQLVKIARAWRVGFEFIRTYRELFKKILEDVVEQASLGYDNSSEGHSFSRHTQLLVAEKLAKKIEHKGIVFD